MSRDLPEEGPENERPISLIRSARKKKVSVQHSISLASVVHEKHGEAHLAITLRLIVEITGNAAELYSETIQAISDLLVTNPHLVERGGKLFDEFDEISLGETRRLARALTLGLPASHVMRVMLAVRLHQEQQGDMLVLMEGRRAS